MRHAPSLRHAFSLLELTLVIAIIGVLMAVAALSLGGFGERANVRATKMTLNVVKRALEAYKLEEKSFPPTVQLLKATKYLEDKKVLDAWNEELIYIVPGLGTREYELRSKGPNKIGGDEDDIDVWLIDR